MKYAIVDAAKAAENGIDLATHRVEDGKVVLNENELLMRGRASGLGNLDVAKLMGGESLLTRSQVRSVTNYWKDRK